MPLDTPKPVESSEDEDNEEPMDAANNVYATHPGLRNARDLALMAEEKWLIETLKTIRKQRHALREERLYYHNMKANLYGQHGIKFGGAPSRLSVPAEPEIELPIPEPVFPELSKVLDQPNFAPNGLLRPAKEEVLKRIKQMGEKQKSDESNLADFNLMEGQCNSEELELSVDQSEKRQENWDIGDTEYEFDGDEEWSRVNIDMDMLVGDNGDEGDI